jgi:hypothetical protein
MALFPIEVWTPPPSPIGLSDLKPAVRWVGRTISRSGRGVVPSQVGKGMAMTNHEIPRPTEGDVVELILDEGLLQQEGSTGRQG